MEHFSGKARVWDCILGLDFPTATCVEGAFFYSTFDKMSHFCGASKTAEGNIIFKIPVLTKSDHLAGFDPADIGEQPLPRAAELDRGRELGQMNSLYASISSVLSARQSFLMQQKPPTWAVLRSYLS